MASILGLSDIGREFLVEHAITGVLSLRHENWKYIEPSDRSPMDKNTQTELGNHPKGFLFDLSNDPQEQVNLIDKNTEKAELMRQKLKSIREQN